MGTMLAMPMPASANPAIAGAGLLDSPARTKPAIATAELARRVVTAPKRRRSPSPAKRIAAIAPAQAAKPRPATDSDAPISRCR